MNMAANRNQPMDARERAIYEQHRRKQRKQRRQRRAQHRSFATRILLLAVIGTALFAGAVIAFVMRDFAKAPEKYSYTLTVLKDGEPVKLSKGAVQRNNVCYFSLSDFSDLLGFRMMGDVNVMSAVFDDGTRVSFAIGTEVATLGNASCLLGAPIYFSGSDGDVLVPVDFFNGAFDGITLSGEKKGGKIDYTVSVNGDFRLAYSSDNPCELPDTSDIVTATQPGSAFVADLSAYEKYMDPENADEYITLINVAHPLDKDYVPDDLTDVVDTRKDRATAQLREYAAKALEAMFIEMRANGFTDVSVTSAYRSYAYQEQLFNNSVNSFMQSYNYETAYAKTAAQIAIPGTSEHQSGLCADLHNLAAASQAFEAQEVYKWLYTHCADFGFILRFPKNKQDITGIIFEPWHYRYVGRYHAQKIMQSGLCLEEYCEQNNIGL